MAARCVGQALVAADRTVEAKERLVHSLHAYFLLPGDPKAPIIYEVDRIRDGGSFTTRRVVAIQHGQAMFTMAVSFHKPEPGFDHQIAMPDVPPPEALASEEELKARLLPNLPEVMRSYWELERPIELRPTDLSRFFSVREGRAEAVYLDQGERAAAGRFPRCISACWPMRRTSRCSIRRWSRMAG